MKLQIKVTKEILEKSMWCGTEKGEQSVPQNCAIALAVRDIFPKAEVGFEHIRPFGRENDCYIEHNQIHYISLFDQTKPQERPLLHELTFTVDLPEQIVNSINIDDIYNSKTLELINT